MEEQIMKSLIFNEKEIIESNNYNNAVDIDVFLNKVKSLTEYEQDYIYKKVVDLKQAEKILLTIQKIMEE
jgi:hypothetical protein